MSQAGTLAQRPRSSPRESRIAHRALAVEATQQDNWGLFQGSEWRRCAEMRELAPQLLELVLSYFNCMLT